MDIHELMKQAEGNFAIFDGFAKAYSVLSRHHNIACSISGGADSDIVLDICAKLDPDKKIRYVWFNTGLEYAATKRHLDYLEEKYGVTIERLPALKSIPLCCRQYGQPFLSKLVSQYIEALQKHGFEWKDEPYEVLIEKYPYRSYIGWWCNRHKFHSYNISNHKYLKEFLIANPPTFPISNKCCTYAKKKVGAMFDKENESDLHIIGVRKAEGGVRSGTRTCFTAGNGKRDVYRPVFWYKDEDKRAYETLFGIRHSDCYEVWGLRRTGCVGCPFNRNIEAELEVIQQYEPNLYQAACHIFKESYEYTRQYREFVRMMKAKER